LVRGIEAQEVTELVGQSVCEADFTWAKVAGILGLLLWLHRAANGLN